MPNCFQIIHHVPRIEAIHTNSDFGFGLNSFFDRFWQNEIWQTEGMPWFTYSLNILSIWTIFPYAYIRKDATFST
jgi:hypothetical protein